MIFKLLQRKESPSKTQTTHEVDANLLLLRATTEKKNKKQQITRAYSKWEILNALHDAYGAFDSLCYCGKHQ